MADYKPLLPKTTPTRRLVVMDLQKDKAAPLGLEVVNTLFFLQGLINRASDEKLYFTGIPMRVIWDSASVLGTDPLELMLEDNLLPFSITRPTIDEAKPYPVLSYLANAYRHLLTTRTLHAATREGSGAACAAINAATFAGALPVTEAVDGLLNAEGMDLPLYADLRGMSNLKALGWSMERFISHPSRNRQCLGFHLADQPASMADYWIATGTFCYYLERDIPSEEQRFAEVLDARYYPPAVPHFGAIEGTRARFRIFDLGHRAVCGQMPNGSVTASIPTDPTSFCPAPTPVARSIPDDAVCVAWCPAGNATDGDAVDFLCQMVYPNLRNDPDAGTAPLGIRVNPYLIDLFPTLFRWFTEQHPAVTDVVANWDDGWLPKTEEGLAAYRRDVGHHLAHCNGALQVVNTFNFYFFENYRDVAHEAFGPHGVHYVIRGYDGTHYTMHLASPQWMQKDQTAYSTQLGWCKSSPEQCEANVRRAVALHPAGAGPLFILAKVGANGAFSPYGAVKQTIARLRRDPDLNRRLVCLTPRDLAQTYKEWVAQSGQNYPLPRTVPVDAPYS